MPQDQDDRPKRGNQILKPRKTIPASEVGMSLTIPQRVIDEGREQEAKRLAAFLREPPMIFD